MLFIFRWRVFLTNIAISPERTVSVVLAACALHNMLRVKFPSYTNALLDLENEITHEVTPGSWRSDAILEDVPPLRGNNSLFSAKTQRDELCDYVNGVGAVAWQDNMV